jgi:hypothetical protein
MPPRYRLKMNMKLTFKSLWACGSGLGSGAIQRLVLRDLDGQPMVPGSTLKGVLRDATTKLAVALDHQGHLSPHEIGDFTPVDSHKSPVDRLFGGVRDGGRIRVSNGSWAKAAGAEGKDTEEAYEPRSTVRHRVSLERILNTARPGHLFTQEMILNSEGESPTTDDEAAAESFWSFEIRGSHPLLVYSRGEFPMPYEYALLTAGALAMERLGGQRSTGLGEILCEPMELRWAPPGEPFQSFDVEAALSVLADLGDPEMYEMYAEEAGVPV